MTSFLFKLGIFLFPLLTNSFVFFETCGFSYMTQTPCHSGEILLHILATT